MASIAERMAGIALAVSARVGAGFWPAEALTETAPVFDSGGSIVTPGAPVVRACSAQVDSVTEAMRQQDGFTEGDVRLLVLAGTLSGPLSTAARIRVTAGPHAATYSVESVALDVASTHWDCRGRRARDGV